MGVFRHYKSVALALCFTLLAGCTRDDICTGDTPTTPLLIITFRDISNPNQPKSVPSLLIRPANDESRVVFTGTSDSIAIPLNVNLDLTSLDFTTNSNSEKDANTDRVNIGYQREDIYVNRACGFKTFYDALSFEREDDVNDAWILTANINQTRVENENQAHITIFH